jgi:hypothetical protein
VLRYEGISSRQVVALGLLPPGDESWTPGVNVVDLGGGVFNAFAAFSAVARADIGFARCMALALQSLNDFGLSE